MGCGARSGLVGEVDGYGDDPSAPTDDLRREARKARSLFGELLQCGLRRHRHAQRVHAAQVAGHEQEPDHGERRVDAQHVGGPQRQPGHGRRPGHREHGESRQPTGWLAAVDRDRSRGNRSELQQGHERRRTILGAHSPAGVGDSS